MVTHYLFDAHTSPIANSRLVDVSHKDISQPITEIPINGLFPVQVDDDLNVEVSSDLNTLVANKATAMLARYPQYANVTSDALLDSTGIDTASSSRVVLGSRGVIDFVNTGSVLVTTATVLGAAPSSVVLRYEIGRVTNGTDFEIALGGYRASLPGRQTRTPVELENLDFADVTAEVSFGAGFLAITNGVPLTIPLANQGTSMSLRFTAAGSITPFRLMSWHLMH